MASGLALSASSRPTRRRIFHSSGIIVAASETQVVSEAAFHAMAGHCTASSRVACASLTNRRATRPRCWSRAEFVPLGRVAASTRCGRTASAQSRHDAQDASATAIAVARRCPDSRPDWLPRARRQSAAAAQTARVATRNHQTGAYDGLPLSFWAPPGEGSRPH